MKKKPKTGTFVLTKLPRMLLIMKSIVILLFCTLNLQAAVYSQQQKKFDISLNNVTVSDVFRYLHEVSQYDFVYDSDAVKQMQPVSVDLQNTDIESVLNTVLAGTPFGWSIEDNVIIIRRNEQPTPSAQQQSKVLKGKVTDKQGNIVASTDGNTITWNVSPCNDYTPGDPNDEPAQPSAAPETVASSQEAAAIVYWTPGGKSYHNSRECSTLSRSKTINEGSLSDALAAGKADPCDVCVK